MNEREIIESLTENVRLVLEASGLEVFHQVEVQLYQRWDRRTTDVIIKATVAPKL